MVQGLTDKQREVLEAIQAFWDEHGVSPSLLDLADHLGVQPPTVHQHVHALKNKGYLEHIAGRSRTWKPAAGVPQEGTRRVPVLGRVAAGAPILAQENVEGYITVDDVKPHDTLFGLRIVGESMIDGGIFEGDVVIVRQQATANEGDIVVALIRGEDATVKKFHRQHRHVVLVPMNCRLSPTVVPGDHVHIQGKVIGVWRRMVEDDE
jgi:repressor LexA